MPSAEDPQSFDGLTEEQQRAIIEWADKTDCISEVRIFGSRARGDHRPESDADIAVTIVVKRAGDTPFGVYIFNRQRWQAELTERIELTADVQWLDQVATPKVLKNCEETSFMLWRRTSIT